MPYQWQFRKPGFIMNQWTSFNLDQNVLEKLYCEVENREVELAFRDERLTFSR